MFFVYLILRGNVSLVLGCILHWVSSVGLCSGVSYTLWQLLVCIIVSLTPCDKDWSVFLCFLHHVPEVVWFLCVLTLVTCQRLVHVRVRLKLSDKCWADSNVSYTVFQWMACIQVCVLVCPLH